MKTPEEIKKDIIDCMEEAIEVGQTCDAKDLLGFSDKAYVCMATTRAYIQQLEADNASKDERIQMLEAGIEQWHDVAASPGAVEDMARENYRLTQEMEAVKRERDAAARDCSEFPCNTCGDKENQDLCCNCIKPGSTRRTNHVWRGVCPENTEVQDGE